MITHSENKSTQYAFRALADPTRRGILILLSDQDRSIGELVGNFDITRAAVKKHLSILEEGGLISVHPKGRERINRLEPTGLKTVNDWLEHFHHFWDERLTSLKMAIEQSEKD